MSDKKDHPWRKGDNNARMFIKDKDLENDYYCQSCKADWREATMPYCPECGGHFRTSDYGMKDKKK